MKKRTAVQRLVLVVVAALALMMGGCNNFMSGGKELKDAIRQEVAEANAPSVQITVRPQEDSMGTTSPLGATSVKVGIPFNIATTVSSEYGFVSWVQEGGNPGDLTFADALATETQATVLRNVSGLGIRATFSDRPVVTSTSPFDNEQEVVITRPVRITFSKGIDLGSVTNDSIRIQRRLFGSIAAFASINDFFEPPFLSGTTVTYNLRDGHLLGSTGAFYEILVTVTTGVRDLQGKTMAATRIFRFVTSKEGDTNPPVAEGLVVKSAAGFPLPANNPTNSRDIILDFEAADPESIELRVEVTDDLGNILYSDIHVRDLSIELADLDGERTVTIVVFDPSGNASSPLTANIILDRQPPSVPGLVDGEPQRPTNNVSFTVASSNAGPSGIAGYHIIAGVLEPVVSANGVFSNVVPTAQGLNTIEIVARDNAGNQGPALALEVDFDSVPPTNPVIENTSATFQDGNTYYCGSEAVDVSFALSSTDEGSGLKGFNTDGSNATEAHPLVLPAGATYTIYAVDYAGNISAGGPTVTVVRDTEGPEITDIGAPTGAGVFFDAATTTYYTTSASPAFTPTATDSGSGLKGFNTDGSTAVMALPLVLSSDGVSTIYAVDNVGNVTASTEFRIVQDDTPPTRPAIAATHNPHYFDTGTETYYYAGGEGVRLSFTSTDAGSGVAGFTTSSDGSGVHEQLTLNEMATVYAADRVGNVSEGLLVMVVRDSDQPALEIIGAPTGAGIFFDPATTTYYTTFASLAFNPSATDSGSGLKGFNTDGGTTVMELPLVLSSDGLHTIYAVDNVGNVAAWPMITITQDSTPPDLGIPDAAGDYGNGFPLPITDGLSGVDTNSIVLHRRDTMADGDWETGPSYDAGSEHVTGLAPLIEEQDDFIRLRVLDNVGNERVIILRRARETGDESYQITAH